MNLKLAEDIAHHMLGPRLARGKDHKGRGPHPGRSPGPRRGERLLHDRFRPGAPAGFGDLSPGAEQKKRKAKRPPAAGDQYAVEHFPGPDADA